jgi:hypothetical protein
MGGCIDPAFHQATSSVLNVKAISTIPIPEPLRARMVCRSVGRSADDTEERQRRTRSGLEI